MIDERDLYILALTTELQEVQKQLAEKTIVAKEFERRVANCLETIDRLYREIDRICRSTGTEDSTRP